MIQDHVAAAICLVVGVFAITVGLTVGAGIERSNFRKEAIERGYGEYHPKTGAWQWKESVNHAD